MHSTHPNSRRIAAAALALVTTFWGTAAPAQDRTPPAAARPGAAENTIDADIAQTSPAMSPAQRRLMTVQMQATVAKDPSAAGVAAVIGVRELLLERRGANATIAYFEDLLPSVTDPAVERAVRLQLLDLYRDGGQLDKALAHAKLLITPNPNR